MTTPTNRTAVRLIGSRVSVNDPKYPGVWIVRSNGPVNATLEPENGGRRLRAPHDMLTDPVATSSVPTVIRPTVFYNPGEFVRVDSGRSYAGGGKHNGLWVVIADRGRDTVYPLDGSTRSGAVNLAVPGGNGGQYLRAPRPWLTKLAVEDVLRPEFHQI
jgi:hypothetical protein